MSLTVTVAPDVTNRAILVSLSGLLTLQSIPAVRRVLLKSLAQAPAAVIVEVGQLRVESRSRLTVFPAAVRADQGSGSELILCGATRELAASMRGGVLGDVAHFETYALALGAVAESDRSAAHSAALLLPPASDAAARARRLVTSACEAWRIPQVIGNAALVVSELVSNAVEHARTDVRVRALYRGRYLHLNVHDGSPALPVRAEVDTEEPVAPRERGRGLYLVDVSATAWGSFATGDGKMVWATLKT